MDQESSGLCCRRQGSTQCIVIKRKPYAVRTIPDVEILGTNTADDPYRPYFHAVRLRAGKGICVRSYDRYIAQHNSKRVADSVNEQLCQPVRGNCIQPSAAAYPDLTYLREVGL